MDTSYQVYRLGNNKALSRSMYWVYMSLYKSKDDSICIKTPFYSVSYLLKYFKDLIAIKNCMYNGRTLVNLCMIMTNKFKEQLWVVV